MIFVWKRKKDLQTFVGCRHSFVTTEYSSVIAENSFAYDILMAVSDNACPFDFSILLYLGKQIVTANGDSIVTIWDASTGQSLIVLPFRGGKISNETRVSLACWICSITFIYGNYGFTPVLM